MFDKLETKCDMSFLSNQLFNPNEYEDGKQEKFHEMSYKVNLST